MIEDMTIRQLGEHTKRDYVRQVRQFTAFLGRSPDQAEQEDLRRYQLYMAELGATYAQMNQAGTALRFFFHVTLSRPGFGDRMARIASPERLPVVLSPEEVALLLAHAPSLKYRAALSVAYGCGLRVSEIAHLKVTDIDSPTFSTREKR
jgi:site-specific recombinase XerD